MKIHFYPRDAVLARVVGLPMVVYHLSVCLSQVDVLWKRMNESSWFDRFLPPILHCVKRKFGYLQNKGTSLELLFQTPDLKIFASAYRSSKRVIDLARQGDDAQSVINWDLVGQLS